MELKKIAAEMQPKSMAARDWVFQVIRAAIVRGVLPGDMPLRQDEISTALSVSHIPVREAFRQLEAQGLVRIYPNRGAVVTRLTREELANIMDTRIMLEIGIIKAALPPLNAEDFRRSDEILSKFANEKNAEAFDELNLQFHFSLYKASKNEVALNMIDQLHANVDRYLRPYYQDDNEKAHPNIKSIDEHRNILDACRSLNADLVAALLRAHLETTKALLLNSPLL